MRITATCSPLPSARFRRIATRSPGPAATPRATARRSLCCGDREVERRSLPRNRLRPDAAAVALDDALGHGEAGAGAGVLLAGVEALEDGEDAIGVAGLEADAVVLHGEEPVGLLLSG